MEDSAVAHQRRARARPGARRRHRPRGGGAAGRRARCRQVHPAARGGRPDGPLRAAHALRHRRGVRLPGPAARRPHRRRSTTSCSWPRRPTSARCSATSRQVRPAAAGRRLRADDRRGRRRRGPGRGHPGQGGRGGAGPGRQDPQHRHDAWSATSPRTAASPARGCSSTSSTSCCTSRATATPGFRMVRAIKNRFGPVDEVGCFDLSGEGIVAVTDPTGLFVEPGTTSPSPGTCVRGDASRAAGRCSPRCRRWSRPRPPSARAARRPGSTLPGRDGARRAPAARPASGCTATTCSPRPSAAPGSSSPRPTSPRRSRVASAWTQRGIPHRTARRDRRDRPGRRAAPGARHPAAARRGRPARVPGRDRARRVAPGRAAPVALASTA